MQPRSPHEPRGLSSCGKTRRWQDIPHYCRHRARPPLVMPGDCQLARPHHAPLHQPSAATPRLHLLTYTNTHPLSVHTCASPRMVLSSADLIRRPKAMACELLGSITRDEPQPPPSATVQAILQTLARAKLRQPAQQVHITDAAPAAPGTLPPPHADAQAAAPVPAADAVAAAIPASITSVLPYSAEQISGLWIKVCLLRHLSPSAGGAVAGGHAHPSVAVCRPRPTSTPGVLLMQHLRGRMLCCFVTSVAESYLWSA